MMRYQVCGTHGMMVGVLEGYRAKCEMPSAKGVMRCDCMRV